MVVLAPVAVRQVAFPIVTTAPGIIGTLWGVLVFREVRGRRNLLVLLAAFTLTFAGIACVTLSKVGAS